MNTRFNPTVNGRLHVGHVYVALLNYHAAKSTGGRFVVRFDDDQPHWRIAIGEEAMDRAAGWVKEDLEWLGLTPDLYSSERAERAKNEDWIEQELYLYTKILPDREIDDFTVMRYQPKIKTHGWPYPYTPYLTAVKVAQDHREGIDTLIRGDDLVDEFSLYCWLCEVAMIPKPAFYYVPRMMRNNGAMGGGLTELTDVSKMLGGCSVKEYRDAGWEPGELVEMLAESALVDPKLGWAYENVRKQPVVRRMP
jgi:glutamyl/glutaminyl-tRNA synthetase